MFDNDYIFDNDYYMNKFGVSKEEYIEANEMLMILMTTWHD